MNDSQSHVPSRPPFYLLVVLICFPKFFDNFKNIFWCPHFFVPQPSKVIHALNTHTHIPPKKKASIKSLGLSHNAKHCETNELLQINHSRLYGHSLYPEMLTLGCRRFILIRSSSLYTQRRPCSP